MALSKDRDTRQRTGDVYSRPVKGGVTIYAGALVVMKAGLAEPGTADPAAVADGRARQQVANTGADGSVSVDVEPGVFRFDSGTGADAITSADIGAEAYVIDDATVGLTSNSGARCIAGRIVDVDAGGVWVAIGIAKL